MPEEFFFTWNKQGGTDSLEVVGSEHDEFILSDRRRIYDFSSTSFQTSFGHSNETIRRRIHGQLDAMPIASPKSVFELKRSVSHKLIELLHLGNPPGGRIFYTVSGAESVENALKIARHFTGRPVILARQRSYHGATLGAMSVSGDWRSRGHLLFAEGTVRIPEPDQDADGRQFEEIVTATGPESIAAVIVETISGVNGVIVPPQSWWSAVQATCSKHGILLIADEVLVGFGRSGPAFGFQNFEMTPDLVCMSKAISGGYVPFGALWTSARIAGHYDQNVLACGLTNYAHPLGLAAVDGVLELLEDPAFQENVNQLQQVFADRLDQLRAHPDITDVRYRGLLAAIDFKSEPPSWRRFLENGLHLVVIPGENMVVVAPPLISTAERLSWAFDQLQRTIDSSSAARLKAGTENAPKMV